MHTFATSKVDHNEFYRKHTYCNNCKSYHKNEMVKPVTFNKKMLGLIPYVKKVNICDTCIREVNINKIIDGDNGR